MTPRQACLACVAREPAATLEAALWVAAEHDPQVQPAQWLGQARELRHQIGARLPALPPRELAQPLLRELAGLGFVQDDFHPVRPEAALLDHVLQRKRGQPLALGLLALELARQLGIELVGINFPGHFLLQVPGADHLLDPSGGRRLYAIDCRSLLARQFGPHMPLRAEHMAVATPRQMLQRLSRNLRQLHTRHGQPLAALRDAERVLELGPGISSDYLARAGLYQQLDCPQAERYDVEHALLLTDDPVQQLRLAERLHHLPAGRGALH